MKNVVLAVVAILVLTGVGYFFFRSQYKLSPTPSGTPIQSSEPTSSAVAQNTVIIQGETFNPNVINAKVGDKITWTNNDSITHTVTADNGDFDSGNLGPGQSFSYIYTKAGTFGYHCTIHTFMTGQVIVTN